MVPSLEGDPAAIVELLSQLAQPERFETRLALIKDAITLHDLNLELSLELQAATGSVIPVEIPSALAMPKVVSPEAICIMAQKRRTAGRQLARHATEPFKHLIVGRQ